MGSNGARWCLIGYGPNRAEMRKRVAHQIAALFRGEAPGNVPIEQPTLFEFAINLKIAKSLDLGIPAGVLVRADEVID
jgi:putative ABC transport system substrate-binding protein